MYINFGIEKIKIPFYEGKLFWAWDKPSAYLHILMTINGICIFHSL